MCVGVYRSLGPIGINLLTLTIYPALLSSSLPPLLSHTNTPNTYRNYQHSSSRMDSHQHLRVAQSAHTPQSLTTYLLLKTAYAVCICGQRHVSHIPSDNKRPLFCILRPVPWPTLYAGNTTPCLMFANTVSLFQMLHGKLRLRADSHTLIQDRVPQSNTEWESVMGGYYPWLQM